MKRYFWALLIACLVLTGCGSTGDSGPTNEQDPYFLYEKKTYTDRIKDQIPLNGELKVGLVGRPKNLHPLYTEDRSGKILVNALFDKLFYLTEDDLGMQAYKPQLAGLTVSEDRTTYRLTLQEGMAWHDGKPIVADDLIYTFETIQNKETVFGSALEVGGQKVEIKKIDDQTVDLVLPIHSNTFAYGLSKILIVPAHLKSAFDQTMITGENGIIGNSAYRFERRLVEAGEKKVVHTDETSLLAADNAAGREAGIRKLNFIVVKHPTSTRSSFTRYIVNMGEIPAREADSLRDKIFKTYCIQENDLAAVAFKLKNPLMQDPEIRKAILQTIPPSSYSGNIGSTYYTHTADSIFGSETAFRSRKEIYHDANNTEARLTFQRYMQKDPNFKLRIGFLVDVGEPQEKFAIAWQELMTTMGIPVEMVPMYQKDYYAKAFDPDVTDFDFCIVDIPGSNNPDDYRLYFESGSDLNISGLSDPELDALWDLADAAPTRDEALVRYEEIQKRILDHQAVYPLIHYVRAIGVDDRIQGVEEAVPGPASIVEHWEKLSIQEFEMDQALVEKYEIDLDKLVIRGQEKKPLIETEPEPIPVPAGEEINE